MHNLFGDTHAVHVSVDDDNVAVLEAVIKGDTVREVLGYVQFDGEVLIAKIRRDTEEPSAPAASTSRRPDG